jgi:hypothetical protein
MLYMRLEHLQLFKPLLPLLFLRLLLLLLLLQWP